MPKYKVVSDKGVIVNFKKYKTGDEVELKPETAQELMDGTPQLKLEEVKTESKPPKEKP